MGNIIWRKIPEVTTGGKTYFYNGYTEGVKMNIVYWDRTAKKWAWENRKTGEVKHFSGWKQALKEIENIHFEHETMKEDGK